MSALAPATVAPLVDAEIAIVRVLWTSAAGTVIVAAALSFLIVFIVRSSEARALGRRGARSLYNALSVLAFAVFAAAVIYGLVLVTQKS